MNLYEFQAKELLARFDVAIPRGRVAGSAEDAERVAHRLGFQRYVVKAQVHAGDRMAGGGIRFATSPAAVGEAARGMLGRPLVTTQTSAAGQTVRWVYVEEAIEAPRLLYAAVMLDRSAGTLALLASAEGGDDIETRAARDPRILVRAALDDTGNTAALADAATRMGLDAPATRRLTDLFQTLAKVATALDATQVEINPLAVTADGDLLALDAKVTIDDHALYRHPNLAALKRANDVEESDPAERGADRHQINYMCMDGDIGLVVNGAGLALATLDALVDAGGRPANFMDIRTTATSLDVAYAVELILANPRVRAILVNVHGGGMQRCDMVAEGLGVGVRHGKRTVPIIVRFAGNNADFAITRLATYGFGFSQAADIGEAARLAARVAGREVA